MISFIEIGDAIFNPTHIVYVEVDGTTLYLGLQGADDREWDFDTEDEAADEYLRIRKLLTIPEALS